PPPLVEPRGNCYEHLFQNNPVNRCFLDSRCSWPSKNGAAMCACLHARVHAPRRTDTLSSPCMRRDARSVRVLAFPVPASCDTVACSVFIGRHRQEAHALPLALFTVAGLPRLKAPGCNGHSRARYFLRLSPAAACAFGFSLSTHARVYGLSRSKLRVRALVLSASAREATCVDVMGGVDLSLRTSEFAPRKNWL